MSYDRMREKEKQIRAEVKQLLEQAEAADAEEDACYGKDLRGDELPEELQRRESRLKKTREAKQAVEARAKRRRANEPIRKRPNRRLRTSTTSPIRNRAL